MGQGLFEKLLMNARSFNVYVSIVNAASAIEIGKK